MVGGAATAVVMVGEEREGVRRVGEAGEGVFGPRPLAQTCSREGIGAAEARGSQSSLVGR